MTREEVNEMVKQLSEQRDSDGLTQIERVAARYEKATGQPWNKPMTNADRIRSLSDEDLAELLMWYCPYPNRKEECEQGCEKCVAEWLRRPVKE